MESGCVFCERIGEGGLVAENAQAAAFPDAYPVSEGHTLVVPRRHEADLFGLDRDERHAVWDLLDEVHARLEEEQGPEGYTVQVRVGRAAGQTVMHAHVHLIPRGRGRSTAEPR